MLNFVKILSSTTTIFCPKPVFECLGHVYNVQFLEERDQIEASRSKGMEDSPEQVTLLEGTEAEDDCSTVGDGVGGVSLLEMT
ncbi:unnamed protein product [Ilex paraguariensis]|uniref:Uncharacterized protein n=1 Tax=Ilex paraguariensis TaxID=185542 RepID=A0ABC8SUS8_9AQUA